MKNLPEIDFKIFNLSKPEDKQAYLDLVNDEGFDPRKNEEGGQVLLSSAHWHEGQYYQALQWLKETVEDYDKRVKKSGGKK